MSKGKADVGGRYPMTASDFHGKPVVPDGVKHTWMLILLWRFSAVMRSTSAKPRMNSVLRRPICAACFGRVQHWQTPRRKLKSGGWILLSETFTKPSNRMIRAGAMRLRCSPFATAIAPASACWITTSASAAELSMSANTNGPREITFRWRTREDDKRDAEAERLRDGGKRSRPRDFE